MSWQVSYRKQQKDARRAHALEGTSGERSDLLLDDTKLDTIRSMHARYSAYTHTARNV